MRAGALDRRLRFERAVRTDDGFASAVSSWAHLATVAGSRADISDGERWRAGEVSAQVTTRFQVRWSPLAATITPADRLICEGVTYDVSGIKQIGRRVGLEITATARAD